MGRTKERLEVANKALLALNEVMQIQEPSSIVRDAAIQRFEFSFETAWKAAKEYLFEYEGIDVGSPKGVIRASREVGILDNDHAKIALEMADDRNLTVHTYNEKLAKEIYGRIAGYQTLIANWLKAIKSKMAP